MRTVATRAPCCYATVTQAEHTIDSQKISSRGYAPYPARALGLCLIAPHPIKPPPRTPLWGFTRLSARVATLALCARCPPAARGSKQLCARLRVRPMHGSAHGGALSSPPSARAAPPARPPLCARAAHSSLWTVRATGYPPSLCTRCPHAPTRCARL